MNIPWVEKYRPLYMDDVFGHTYITECLKNYGGISSMPNLLFHGPPGTGKTSTILAMAREHYCTPDQFNSMVVELNASDERNISVVNDKILSFVRSNPIIVGERRVKLVILDEADALTIDAQVALRRIMEDFTSHVRFCMCCNYVNKISDSLQSRCAKFRFQGIGRNGLNDILLNVIEKEKMEISQNVIDVILDSSNGDARRVINTLQAISSKKDLLSIDDVYEYTGGVSHEDMDLILEICINSKIEESYRRVQDILVGSSYSLQEIIHFVVPKILNYHNICNKKRILSELSDIEYNLSIGSSESISLSRFVSCFKN